LGLVSIKQPELLQIDGGRYYGGSQEWYDTFINKRAGCGPVTCCHIMMYLAKSRQGLLSLAHCDCQTKQGFLGLMEDVWNYVTPGRMG
jgi:hypothetical protein